jgi:phage gpG-like protein
MAEMSLQKFIKLMASETDDLQRRIMQFQFELGTKIRERMILNADSQFGKVRGKPWSRPVSGALRRSIQMQAEDRQIVITAGGPGVPYAAIHEFGGVIKPRRRLWLTVPAKEKYVRRRAREFALQFIEIKPGRLAALIDPRAPVGDQVAYWLVKRVTIPPRPYFVPAVRQVTGGRGFDLIVGRYLVRGSAFTVERSES